MNGQSAGKDRSVNNDRKDALEAFNSFNGARNLVFWIFLLIPLLVIEVDFWAVHSGVLDKVLIQSENANEAAGSADKTNQQPDKEAKAKEPALSLNKIQETLTPSDTAKSKDAELNSGRIATENRLTKSLDKLIQASLKTSNYVLTFAAVVYCLTLLIGMKLALIGQLGGLADASKAFFLALIAMVFILPWQQVMSDGIHGTLFSYKELTDSYLAIKGSDDPKEYVLYFGRFAALWGLTVVLLGAAQLRSSRAVRKIRQRLTAPAEVGERHPVDSSKDKYIDIRSGGE